MKKIILSIITFLYLAVSSGVAMEIHYCMGEKAGVDFFATAESKKCGKCGMKDTKSGCCNDEHKFYKLDNAHKNVQVDQAPLINFVEISTIHYSYDLDWSNTNTLSVPNNNSPPILENIPIYLRNCLFRI